MYGNVALPQKVQFRYLGKLVHKHMNLQVSEEHAVQPYMAAQQRMKKFVHEHGLRNRPHTQLWLSKVYGIPAGMYPCQVWGTEYLREVSEPRSQLQERYLCSEHKCLFTPRKCLKESLRRFLGERSTATNWPVLRECGQEPLPFYWFRATTNGMRNEDVFKQKMLSASKIPMQDFKGDLRYRQQKVWREADAFSPREVNRKAVTSMVDAKNN
eukprot:1088071-Pelagomonas_calceolata.AAC.1